MSLRGGEWQLEEGLKYEREQIYMMIHAHTCQIESANKTRSNWLNCALRDDEAVYWVSIGHYEAEAVSN